MELNEYQQLANRTLIDEPDFAITATQIMLVWNATGLAGEAGEAVDLIKKAIFHQQGLDKEKLKKELGDVLWYVAALAKCAGTSLEEIATLNIEKLKARYPDGYSAERSICREGMAQ